MRKNISKVNIGTNEYSLNPNIEEIDATSATTWTIYPNKFYNFGSVTALTITLSSSATDSNTAREYMFQFTASSTATTLSTPSSIKWIGDTTITSGKTYDVSILNNLGVMGGA